MRKNKMMRLASVLLVAVLLSTCAISGTFAKYVTSATASDSARVAKFGIVLTASGATFSDTYGTTVIAGDSTDVVAPGTASSSDTTFTINGTAETSVKVEMSLDTSSALDDVWLKAGTYTKQTTSAGGDYTLSNDYYPVQFTLVHTFGDDAFSIKPAADAVSVSCTTTAKTATAKAYDTVTGTLADIEKVLAKLTTQMTSVNPNYTFDDTFALSWAWSFTGNDEADTILGNLAAGEYQGTAVPAANYSTSVAYSFKITVTQID